MRLRTRLALLWAVAIVATGVTVTIATLAVSGGNISRAARAAGKDRKSFWELLCKHEIEASRFRDW